MAGELSEELAKAFSDMPKSYVAEVFSGDWVIRCRQCGMRWYAAKMTHWANQVFLQEHASRHKPVRRKRTHQLPTATTRKLPRREPD